MMITPLLDKITHRLNEKLYAVLPKKKKYYLKTSAFWLGVAIIGAYGIVFNRSTDIIIDMFFGMCFLAGPFIWGYHIEQFFIHRKKYKQLCKHDTAFLQATHTNEHLLSQEVAELLSFDLPEYAVKTIYEKIASGRQLTYNDVVAINKILAIEPGVHETTKLQKSAAIKKNVEQFMQQHNLDKKHYEALTTMIEQDIPAQHKKTFNSRKVL